MPEKLQKIRTKKLGLTMTQVSALTGASLAQIHRLEMGQLQPKRLRKLARFCDVYGLTLDELADHVEAMREGRA